MLFSGRDAYTQLLLDVQYKGVHSVYQFYHERLLRGHSR